MWKNKWYKFEAIDGHDDIIGPGGRIMNSHKSIPQQKEHFDHNEDEGQNIAHNLWCWKILNIILDFKIENNQLCYQNIAPFLENLNFFPDRGFDAETILFCDLHVHILSWSRARW